MNTRKLLSAELKRNLEKGGRPTLPAGGELLWRWFEDLCSSRVWSDVGPGPITYAEIEAYARLMRLPLEPRHVVALKEMDAVFLEHCFRERQRALSRQDDRAVAPIALSADRFDAVFG